MEDTVESLREKLAALSARNQELERALKAAEAEAGSAAREVVELKRAAAERIKMQGRLEHLLLSSHVVLYASKPAGDYGATFISDNITEQFGYSPRDFLDYAPFWAERIHPEDAARVFNDLPALFEHGHHFHEYRFLHKDGTYRWVHDHTKVVRDQDGNVVELVGTWQDVTQQKRTEQTIKEQAAALMELSTPIIPISDHVLAMPLIGVVDARRAGLVLETMLDGIVRSRARVAILDITGVKEVDKQVAQALARVSQAVQLLGTQLVLTGIRPEVAQTLVTIGADLGKIVTCGTLQAGIAYATRTDDGRGAAPSSAAASRGSASF